MQSSQNIKIAIAYDGIMEQGGGEKVLALVASLFPHATIFTPVVTRDYSTLTHNKSIQTSWLNMIPIVRHSRLCVQLFSPLVWKTFDISSYDIIISIGGFYASYLVELSKGQKTLHIHYAISHAHTIFSSSTHNSPFFLIKYWYPWISRIMQQAMRTIPCVYTDSQYLQSKLFRTFHKTAKVIYPPVSLQKKKRRKQRQRRIYCCISRLSKEKNLDILIKTFNANGLPLFIIGDGPLYKQYKQIAHKNITFTGFLKPHQYAPILARTQAYIHTSIDDALPMAPLEAMSMGIPVIGFYGGGMKEIIQKDKTGIFFYAPTPTSLQSAIQKFQIMTFRDQVCKAHAQKFSKAKFVKKFQNMVMSEYERFRKKTNSNHS